MDGVHLLYMARRHLDDFKLPYRHTTAEIMRSLNEGEREAARRTRCFVDNYTAAITSVSVLEDTSEYDLDPRVLYVLRAKMTLGQQPLLPITEEELDDQMFDWRSDSGEPERYVIARKGAERLTIELWRNPDADDTLSLKVVRFPLQQFHNTAPWVAATVYRMHDEVTEGSTLHECTVTGTSGGSEPTWNSTEGGTTSDGTATWTNRGSYSASPEIDEQYHQDLIYWAGYRLWQNPDEDNVDEGKSGRDYGRFSEVFGPPVSLNTQRFWQNQFRSRRVRQVRV